MDCKNRFLPAVLSFFTLYSTAVNATNGKAATAFAGTAAAVLGATQVVSRAYDRPIVPDERILGVVKGAGHAVVHSYERMPETMSPSGLWPRLAVSGETIQSMKRTIILPVLSGGHSDHEPTSEEIMKKMASQTTRSYGRRTKTDAAILADQILELQKNNRAMAEQLGRIGLFTEQMGQMQQQLDAGTLELREHTEQLKQLGQELSDLEVHFQIAYAKTTDGRQLWRVPEMGRRMQEAKEGKVVSIFSAPFYTSPDGYKLCLRAYLNGDGAGEGLYLSVFLVVMKGEYDPLLEWPFDYNVKFTLRDQSPDIEKRKDFIRSFNTNKSSASFQRPVSGMNIATGIPQFIPLSQLKPHSKGDTPDGESWYIMDDTMFVEAVVRPTATLEKSDADETASPEDMDTDENVHVEGHQETKMYF